MIWKLIVFEIESFWNRKHFLSNWKHALSWLQIRSNCAPKEALAFKLKALAFRSEALPFDWKRLFSNGSDYSRVQKHSVLKFFVQSAIHHIAKHFLTRPAGSDDQTIRLYNVKAAYNTITHGCTKCMPKLEARTHDFHRQELDPLEASRRCDWPKGPSLLPHSEACVWMAHSRPPAPELLRASRSLRGSRRADDAWLEGTSLVPENRPHNHRDASILQRSSLQHASLSESIITSSRQCLTRSYFSCTWEEATILPRRRHSTTLL